MSGTVPAVCVNRNAKDEGRENGGRLTPPYKLIFMDSKCCRPEGFSRAKAFTIHKNPFVGRRQPPAERPPSLVFRISIDAYCGDSATHAVAGTYFRPAAKVSKGAPERREAVASDVPFSPLWTPLSSGRGADRSHETSNSVGQLDGTGRGSPLNRPCDVARWSLGQRRDSRLVGCLRSLP
jgi:hypothetical protein